LPFVLRGTTGCLGLGLGQIALAGPVREGRLRPSPGHFAPLLPVSPIAPEDSRLDLLGVQSLRKEGELSPDFRLFLLAQIEFLRAERKSQLRFRLFPIPEIQILPAERKLPPHFRALDPPRVVALLQF
jgi:hypothetical protein